SAWNDLGSMHVARHPRRLYRIESHAGCGFMITRDFFYEVLPLWPSPTKDHDWDVWMRLSKIRGGRECIVPDVSRTFHFAQAGTHVQPLMQQAQFAGHIVTTNHRIKLDNVERMTLSEYEEDLVNLLQSPNIHYVNTSIHPCHKEFIPRNYTKGPVVIFIKMGSGQQYMGWRKIASQCLGLWHIDTRSHHRGLFRFSFYETEVFIIGFRFSEYSYLKPNWILEIPEAAEESIHTIEKLTLFNRMRFRHPEMEQYYQYYLLQMPTPTPVLHIRGQ
ncbi:unnamed protein product, partial [Meganyctiphanes norvegica]